MITLADAKLQLRLIANLDDADSYTAEDSLVERLITAAYRFAERRTGMRFLSESVTLVLDRFPAHDGRIRLPWTPVQAIEDLEYVAPDGATQSIDPETLRLDTRPIFPTIAPQYGSRWPSTTVEPECITITATVGYEQTPEDVQVALLLLISHLYENREAVVTGTIATEVPLGVDALLAPFVIHPVG